LRVDIDRAIDEVARQLTAGEPGGAFRARVMARIERGESRRVWSTRLMAPMPVAALLLIALVAMWSYRAYRSPAASPELTQTASEPRGEVLRGALQPATARRVEAPVQLAPSVPPSRSPAALPSSARPMRARPMQPSEVGALAPPPLDMPSIALAPIDRGDSIRLEQLEPIAPIDLAPLAVEPPN
jgi:hypothetical protein